MSGRRTALRFAGIGVVNTAIDLGLFLLLHGPLGVVVTNLVSTSAGMAFSFVANGRYTFAGRLTPRTAALFVASTGTTMWVVQPLVIETVLRMWDAAPVAKLVAIGASVAVNYVACRHLVWPVRSGRRPSGRDAAPSAARR